MEGMTTMARKRSSAMDELWDDLGMSGTGSRYKGGHSSSYSGYSSGYKRCYESHPPLPLPGTELVVYGGSCSNPVVTDADVYIGFDSSMARTQRSWPWKKGMEFLFKITDMQAPDNAEEFKKLIAWSKKQIDEGKKLHAGCIGGHGRTGTFLAALVSEYGEKDAISYVREHYCQKAVESSVQVDFLKKHFGIIPAKGAKSYGTSKTNKKTALSVVSEKPDPKTKVYSPIAGMGSIWG
jgi:hypothetical protein